MEVLVGATVFVIGFSLLIALLNSTLLKFSSEELILATATAESEMIRTVAEGDTVSSATTVTNGEMRFKVVREITRKETLFTVSLKTYRLNRDTELVYLYNEFSID